MSAPVLEAPLCLRRRALTRLPSMPLPAGTVDAHFHVFRAGAPLASPRSYTPQNATIEEWVAFANRLGIARGVLVQPSVYGLDNAVLLEALDAFPDRLRAVVVIDPETSAAELGRLDRLGVRGVRINTRNKGGLVAATAVPLARRIAPLGWSLQLQAGFDQLAGIVAALEGVRLPIVVDHLGLMPMDDEVPLSGIATLRRLMDAADVRIKATAPYRLAPAPGYGGFACVVAALAGSHPDRLLWGSDWPHTELWQSMPDDADLIDCTRGAIDGAGPARVIFATNADALYFGH